MGLGYEIKSYYSVDLSNCIWFSHRKKFMGKKKKEEQKFSEQFESIFAFLKFRSQKNWGSLDIVCLTTLTHLPCATMIKAQF